MRLSVITVNLNNRACLEATLASVRAQTFPEAPATAHLEAYNSALHTYQNK